MIKSIKFKRTISTTHKASIQALADILRSALYCHSKEIRVPVANPSNAQLEGTPTIAPIHTRVRAVV